MNIGIDFGGVIVKQADGENPFNPKLGLSLEVENAIDSISKLVELTNGNVWIISKASKSTQIATREWLKEVGFYPSNLHFCSKRSEKKNLCLPLGITHFIDDSEEVLNYLENVVSSLFLFGQTTSEKFQTIESWSEFLRQLESEF